MPFLADHHGSTLIKVLVMGDSGTGKTGSLESLIRAGFKLKILDLDNGLDILASRFSQDSPLLSNVEFETISQERKWDPKTGALKKTTAPEAWPEAMRVLTRWTDPAAPDPLTPQHILVIDSLTRFGNYALDNVLFVNNRLGENPTQPEWGAAQRLLQNVISMLFSDVIPCHVIVLTHVRVLTLDTGKVKWMPSSLGQALSEIIPTFANNMIFYQTQKDKRMLTTQPSGFVDVKVTNPNKVKQSYTITEGTEPGNGLALFFRDMGVEWPSKELLSG